MPSNIVVVGAGGFARETLDVIEAINSVGTTPSWRVLGVADDHLSDVNLGRLRARGYAHIGGQSELLTTFRAAHYVVGIGSPAVRARVAEEYDLAGWHAATLIHPGAAVGSESTLGEGVVVCGGVQLSTNTRLGRHVHLNPGVIIGHDSVLDDFVSVNPGAVISGDVSIACLLYTSDAADE